MSSAASDKRKLPSRRKRRWWQFGLPTLLGMVTLSAIGLALIVHPAERQRRDVATVRSLGGRVAYEDGPFARTRIPSWLRKRLGDDYFANVVSVSLDDTQVSDAELAHLKGLTGLEWLGLDDTKIGNPGLEHLKGLTALQGLGLHNTKVGDTGLEHLKGLTGLQVLYLNNTEVSDAGLEHLKGLTALKGLHLNGTYVSDSGLEHVKVLTGLQSLHLDNTGVSDAGCDHLQQALPNCRIIR
jgi:Leucine-rich repeat (LRR) protein